jgi:hypothetical protein
VDGHGIKMEYYGSFPAETGRNFCFRPKANFVDSVQITARRIILDPNLVKSHK